MSHNPEESEAEQYEKFRNSMVRFCHCEPYGIRPCDGVLAGGLCDGAVEDRFTMPEEDDGDE